MKTLDDLLSLVRNTGIDMEHSFKEVHHFAKRPPFKPHPLGFSGFVRYCQNLSRGIRPGQENEQTIQRAYRYAELRRTRGHEQALSQAWNEFPLLTR